MKLRIASPVICDSIVDGPGLQNGNMDTRLQT